MHIVAVATTEIADIVFLIYDTSRYLVLHFTVYLKRMLGVRRVVVYDANMSASIQNHQLVLVL